LNRVLSSIERRRVLGHPFDPGAPEAGRQYPTPMRPMKERRSLKVGLDSRFGSFFKGRSCLTSQIA
jgi:hypothetical protein